MSSSCLRKVACLALVATVAAQAALYDQCGGQTWTGSTSCAAGSVCTFSNPWYSQCLPAGQGSGDTSGSNSGSTNNLASVQNSFPTPSAAVVSPVEAIPAASSSSAAYIPSGGSVIPVNSKLEVAGNLGSTEGSMNTNPSTCGAFTGSKAGYASTTNYGAGGTTACGCSGDWQLGSGNVITAAGTANLFDEAGKGYCGSGCGKCYKLTHSGYLPHAGAGTCAGAGDSIIVMLTNLCPSDGNSQWCNVPNADGFGAHFDLMSAGLPLGKWDNPVVKYEAVACPQSLTSGFASCSCGGASTSRVMRRKAY